MHISNRLDITLLSLLQFLLQVLHLGFQRLDITIQPVDVVTYGVYRLALVGYLVIDNQQVLQSLLNIALVGLKLPLLLLYLLAHLLLLVLQAVNRYGLTGCGFLVGSILCGSLLGSRSFLSCRRTLLGRRFLRLLGYSRRRKRNECHKHHQQILSTEHPIDHKAMNRRSIASTVTSRYLLDTSVLGSHSVSEPR